MLQQKSTDKGGLLSASAEGEGSDYEGAAEDLKAPSPPPLVQDSKPKALTYKVPSLVDEDVYEACIRYVKKHPCYGSKFLKQMVLRDIKNDSAFYYVLETFCEKRQSAISCVPYNGQYIDGPENGAPPNPWEIQVQPPDLFREGKTKVEIPHTDNVRRCEVCLGYGRVHCNSCRGTGGENCRICSGSGQRLDNSCLSCSGTGIKRCTWCDGHGQVKCKKCKGFGNLKYCRILIASWHLFSEGFSNNKSNLPIEKVKKVTGQEMLFEEGYALTPITNAPDELINEASSRIIHRHRTDFRTMRILKQRHTLSAVPLTKVDYSWRGKDGEFYVYGQEKTVYFKKYPNKCCCCTCL